MPIYMDVHIVPGVNAKAVAEAHSRDVLLQEEHQCKCMTYWIDEARESVFCLIEAPSMEAVVEMHNEAHGLIPHKIIEVSGQIVESFLGRLYDPSNAEVTPDGLKVFHDPSFRVLIITTTTDPVLLQHQLGREQALALLQRHNAVIRRNLAEFGGREAEQEGSGFIISFSSALQAVNCALAIHNDLSKGEADALGFRMSINSGEPVQGSSKIFGETIQKARHICFLSRSSRMAMTTSVKALVEKDQWAQEGSPFLTFSKQDEEVLLSLFQTLEEQWQNPDFDIEEFGRAVAMSKSQLYRKCIALTGLAPNDLLKEFRLEKAKELMKKQYYNIAQVTFDSGFSSPSYFTKCFKKKYGILPMSYVELLQ